MILCYLAISSFPTLYASFPVLSFPILHANIYCICPYRFLRIQQVLLHIVTGSTAVTVDDEDDDDNVGLIVGVVLGILAFCIILVVAVVWWIKRKRSFAFSGSSVSVMELKETNR